MHRRGNQLNGEPLIQALMESDLPAGPGYSVSDYLP